LETRVAFYLFSAPARLPKSSKVQLKIRHARKYSHASSPATHQTEVLTGDLRALEHKRNYKQFPIGNFFPFSY